MSSSLLARSLPTLLSGEATRGAIVPPPAQPSSISGLMAKPWSPPAGKPIGVLLLTRMIRTGADASRPNVGDRRKKTTARVKNAGQYYSVKLPSNNGPILIGNVT